MKEGTVKTQNGIQKALDDKERIVQQIISGGKLNALSGIKFVKPKGLSSK